MSTIVEAPPTDDADRLPLPSTLSPSKISTFTDCALRFRFSAIDRLPEAPSVPATRGSAVHRVLEHLFRRPAAERTMPAALEDLATTRVEVEAWDDYTGLGLTDEDAAAFWADAERLVERYFTMEDPTQINAVGLEVMLGTDLGGVQLRGIIDRLDWVGPGQLVVVDYKTGKAPHPRYEQGATTGVKTYALLVQQVLGVLPVRIRLIYLGGDEPTELAFTVTEQKVRAMSRKATAVWVAIERAHATDGFRPNSGPLCEWCSFQAYCPAFGGDPAEARRVVVEPPA
ncbi:MAG TPA: PD-(D/E)XK nuclease family protein [Acidimicrobiales bacterium]